MYTRWSDMNDILQIISRDKGKRKLTESVGSPNKAGSEFCGVCRKFSQFREYKYKNTDGLPFCGVGIDGGVDES